MKRRISILIIAFVLFAIPAWAIYQSSTFGNRSGIALSSLCVGGELFCTDFETDPTWDASNGTEDCDGYDTDGDYCDDDTTTYKNGAEAFGAQGASTYYLQEALSSTDQTEFYFEVWWRIDDTSLGQTGPGVYNSGHLQVAVLDASYGTPRVVTKGGSSVLASSGTMAADTWTHYGVYFKNESSAELNDGVVRMWYNTDGGEFDAADVIYNNAAADCGSSAEGYNGDEIRVVGPHAGYIAWTDDFVVKSGAPSWAYE